MKETRVKKDFVDKISGESHPEGKIVKFEDERAKALSDLGFVEIIGAKKAEPIKEEAKAEPVKAKAKTTKTKTTKK